jgi:hypothetical protein
MLLLFAYLFTTDIHLPFKENPPQHPPPLEVSTTSIPRPPPHCLFPAAKRRPGEGNE